MLPLLQKNSFKKNKIILFTVFQLLRHSCTRIVLAIVIDYVGLESLYIVGGYTFMLKATVGFKVFQK